MASSSGGEETHTIKYVEFLGQRKPIILQKVVGPCPLVAICNVLLLKHDLDLSPNIRCISQKKLLTMVSQKLITIYVSVCWFFLLSFLQYKFVIWGFNQDNDNVGFSSCRTRMQAMSRTHNRTLLIWSLVLQLGLMSIWNSRGTVCLLFYMVSPCRS